MVEDGYIYIAILVIVLLIVIFGVRNTLKGYRDASDGKISGLKDALKFEKDMGRQAKELSNMIEALDYIEFKKHQEDIDKIAVFFRNIRYILGIICAYIFGIIFLYIVCVQVFAWNIGEYFYFHLAGMCLISMGISGLCVMKYPADYLPQCWIHPLMICIPKDWKKLSTIDKIGVVLINGLFIVLGIGGIAAQHIVK